MVPISAFALVASSCFMLVDVFLFALFLRVLFVSMCFCLFYLVIICRICPTHYICNSCCTSSASSILSTCKYVFPFIRVVSICSIRYCPFVPCAKFALYVTLVPFVNVSPISSIRFDVLYLPLVAICFYVLSLSSLV